MEGMEAKEQVDEIVERPGHKRFNQYVAIAVTLVAVFMAFGKIKDDNIVQAMMQMQAQELDQWNQFQAKSTKQHLYEVQIEQWELQENAASPPMLPYSRYKVEEKLKNWKAQVARYDKEKADLQKQAKDSRAEYDRLNFHDDQFDLSEALLGLAIALFAVSSLAASRLLLGLGMGAGCVGIIMGLAGFLGWNIHPSIIRFLT